MLPRMLSLSQVEHLTKRTTVEIEMFGFGALAIMIEGPPKSGAPGI